MRTYKSAAFLLLLALALAISGCEKKAKEAGTKTVREVPVQVEKASRGQIQELLYLTGDIEPWQQVAVVPDIAGKVAKIYVEEGDFVQKGQVLAKLDTRALRIQQRQAKAALAAAKANFENAKRDWQRVRELREKGAISPQQYDKALLGYQAAEAQLQQAKAALDLIEHNLRVSVMRAPFPGVVVAKNINEGETVNPMMPGGRGVVHLMDLSRVKVKVKAPERYLTEVKPGLKALIRVDAYPDRTFEGEVSIVNPTADPMTRSFEVQITVPNPEMKLRPGLFARVELIVKEKDEALLASRDALLHQSQGYYLFVVRDGKAIRREVQLGLQGEYKVEITQGLKEGEQVVVVGKEMLQDGSPVRVVES